MAYDEEKKHGQPTVVSSTSPDTSSTEQRSTADEKFAGTDIDVDSRGSSSTQEYNNVRIKQDNGIFSKLRNWEAALDRKLGIESQAIDRKLPEDRMPQTWHSQLNMALLWASGTMNISCFATGFLGYEFGLDLMQSILIVIFGSLLGAAVSGFCATLGPATGLRQISICRYSFGWWPSKIIAALNTIEQIGWSAVGCITGGLALTAVSDGAVSSALGIVIIACGSLVISFVGLRAILVYEKYAWLVFFIIFMIMYGEAAPSADATTPSALTGATLSGTVLSLLAIVYGSSASWATIVSDYYTQYPADTSRTKVFLLTTLGIAIPTSIGMVLGCCVGSALGVRTDWAATYTNQGIGFLIQEMLYPRGFAKFLLVLLVLSGINMNILNTYSAALSIQQFARPLSIIPRFLWTILCFACIIALALAGRNSLLSYLENFLALLGYWNTSFFVIVFSEHYLFRGGNINNYDLDGWNDPKRLPIGIASFVAFGLGVVAWVLGMVETWYIGPLGALIGEYGGDVGNEFAFIVTLVAFLPLRYYELRWIGR